MIIIWILYFSGVQNDNIQILFLLLNICKLSQGKELHCIPLYGYLFNLYKQNISKVKDLI